MTQINVFLQLNFARLDKRNVVARQKQFYAFTQWCQTSLAPRALSGLQAACRMDLDPPLAVEQAETALTVKGSQPWGLTHSSSATDTSPVGLLEPHRPHDMALQAGFGLQATLLTALHECLKITNTMSAMLIDRLLDSYNN